MLWGVAIESFADPATEDLFHGTPSRRVRGLPQDVRQRALDLLDALNAAAALDDMASPPGNRLEALKGDFKGFHSVRVNKQWRLVFRWANGAHDVQLVDYH